MFDYPNFPLVLRPCCDILVGVFLEELLAIIRGRVQVLFNVICDLDDGRRRHLY